ncbi:RNA-binding protein [Oceanimonas pelagia]|uniref:RNA-binding protein n=1 Tax=Oceanimonas pelagia TaxID=3028314 RepID=A0AA50KMH9_9GAMM|nr:RNA-binding protein [Oceanimonas pelagia]WMC10289.1 RNA-binding protein [Oceanimonas pelagia]
MKLFQHSPFIQSVLLALLLALAGGGLIAISTTSLSYALWFAFGATLGGAVVPLLIRKPALSVVTTTTLYVGNLPYRANEAVVRALFEQFGQVLSVRLMKDRNTGKRRGFGFVEMPSDAADKARKALNDTEFQQRTLKVREANERKDDEENDTTA